MATSETRDDKSTPDASDVVEGPVGSAFLKEPKRAAEGGADLEALPRTDVPMNDDTEVEKV